MTKLVRAADPAEFPLLRDLFCEAFGKGEEDEAPLWDYLLTDPAFRPEYVRVAEHQGEPVACTVLVPRQIRTRLGWVPGAIVTLVACRASVQRQGYGRATVEDALRYMTEHGMAVGVLYGHEHYYPKFGFAPIFPHFDTLVLQAAAGSQEEALVDAQLADLPRLTELYQAQCGLYPGAVARTPEPWVWVCRNPAVHQLRVLPDRAGYAFTSTNTYIKELCVHEAGAPDIATAQRLLAGLWRQAADEGLDRVRLALPPDHLLCQIAAATTLVQQRHNSARWGMAAVTDWRPLLPAGYDVTPEGLTLDGHLVLAAPRQELVQLVLGYRSAADLVRAGRPVWQQERLERDFPPALPRWSMAPYWFWFPHGDPGPSEAMKKRTEQRSALLGS